MVRKYQERENYDDYDPVPYQGGYDQAAVYGSVKPADEETGYRRVEFGEDADEQEVQYGNESNPYGRGPSGPPISSGRPRPGGVYGGGRDRTRPSYDDAQPDDGVETGYGQGYGRRKPEYVEEEEYNKPSYEDEDSGYRPTRPSHEDRHSGYRHSRREEEQEVVVDEEGYGRKQDGEEGYGGGYGRGEEEGYGGGYGGSYGRKERDDDEQEEEGRHHHGHHKKKDEYEEGDEGGYRSRRDEEEPSERKSWW